MEKSLWAVGNNRQFTTLCEIMGISEIAENEKFRTNEARVQNMDELKIILENKLQLKSIQVWLELFSEKNILCGPIHTIDQVFDHPQVAARDMLVQVNHPVAGTVKLVGSPIKLSKSMVEIKRHPPAAGEHTEEILHEAGFSQEEIARLIEKKII